MRQADVTPLVEEPEPDVSGLVDHPRQPGRRASGSIASRRSRATCPSARSGRVAPLRRDTGDGWPGALAAAGAAAAAARADRDRGAAAGPSAGVASPGAASAGACKRADGPERVFGEWWQRDAELVAVRDYFRVEDEAGERFWLFRAGDGEDAGDRLAALVPARRVRMSGRATPNCRCTSHFSFLRGASSCEELFAQAAVARHRGARPSSTATRLAGIVRAHEAAKATGVRLIVGCRLDLTDGTSVLVYPTDRAGLCPALPAAVARQEARRQGEVPSRLGRSRRLWRGPDRRPRAGPGRRRSAPLRLRRLREAFGDRAYLALTLRRRPNDQLRLHELSNLAARCGCRPSSPTTCCSTSPARRILQDVVTCIRAQLHHRRRSASGASATPTAI